MYVAGKHDIYAVVVLFKMFFHGWMNEGSNNLYE